ncbi:type VII secretion protein EccB [Leucobacter albus]|uniref:Type VII secretion protein EccB n=1 Tax=Leucobacter albus TaxID=272210 RepID=A0ABW3TRP4_9MICO
MATKKDLIEAQAFSRNRLLSAFIGGAPGGKELEPAKPLRAVFGGIALTAMVILAGVFIGLLRPGLPGGWENNRLVVARDTGARYVSVEGVLHPVINTVSARVLIPADEFAVVSVNQSSLSGIPIGGTIGILGGPDTLPAANDLDGRNWVSCGTHENTEVWLGGQDRTAAPAGSGTVVTRDGDTFVIGDGISYAVPAGQETAVLRAIGLESAAAKPVRGDWLALFDTGADLTPLSVPGAGQTAPGQELPVGSVIHPVGSPETERYLLTADGALAPLSPLAHRLYLLADGGSGLGNPVEVSPASIAQLPTVERAGGADWPEDTLTPLPVAGAPCATLAGPANDQRTALAGGSRSVSPTAPAAGGATVHVPENVGALVRGGRTGSLVLIDSTGTAYQLPGGVGVNAKQLGYSAKHVTTVPAGWVRLLPAGPELTPEAAGATPESP